MKAIHYVILFTAVGAAAVLTAGFVGRKLT